MNSIRFGRCLVRSTPRPVVLFPRRGTRKMETIRCWVLHLKNKTVRPSIPSALSLLQQHFIPPLPLHYSNLLYAEEPVFAHFELTVVLWLEINFSDLSFNYSGEGSTRSPRLSPPPPPFHRDAVADGDALIGAVPCRPEPTIIVKWMGFT